MNKSRLLTLVVSVVFVMTLVSSVQADSVHTGKALQKLNVVGEFQSLELSSCSKADFQGFVIEHFDTAKFGGFMDHVESAGKGNNGVPLGFSVVQGHSFGKFALGQRPTRPTAPTVTQNPEPTAMLLLGTGLAGIAAFARRRARRRKS